MRILIWIAMVLLIPSPSAVRADTDISTKDQQALIVQSRTAIRIYAKSLKTALVGAMHEGGAVAAISVCHAEAMPITRRVSAEQGLHLSRVSLKYRNPHNAPSKWQRTILKRFATRKAQGEPITRLRYAAVIEQNGQRQFRYMQAIPTQAVCLRCHGKHIAPEVKRKLAQLYPDDRATGFDLRDIRGAFVVTKKLHP